ncbi:MAG: hypothetical protein KGH61_01555 [Candidatus Micrarchaeota archaeon]|nr:hypothetical protein [Candidatus Micrarchaeota archaeon]MDE1847617.1 hypothetical protein [Candidatus Micrarchaeota archaeon]MDE1863820.1 hypothetical protein [Candidatus Micrarchaeota archaeon]
MEFKGKEKAQKAKQLYAKLAKGIEEFGPLAREKGSAFKANTKAFFTSLLSKDFFSNAQILTAADGCGICPPCIAANAVIGVSAVVVYISKKKEEAQKELAVPDASAISAYPFEASHQLYWDGALRCC